MSPRNLDAVRDAFAQLPRAVEAFYALLDPDVEFDTTSSSGPYARVYRGRDDVREFVRHWVGSWAEYDVRADEFIDAGENVVVVLTERGRGRGSGIAVENRLAQVWTMRNGKAVRICRYPTRAEALRAAGLES